MDRVLEVGHRGDGTSLFLVSTPYDVSDMRDQVLAVLRDSFDLVGCAVNVVEASH
ncbi:hypothetical protein AB0J43_00255 [Nonomuraea fuscirosea]